MKAKKRQTIIFYLLILSIIQSFIINLVIAHNLKKPVMAIYDDMNSKGASANKQGLLNIEKSLGLKKLVFKRMSRKQLNKDDNILSPYNVIIFGGGYAYPGYTLYITQIGKEKIRTFVKNGGIYIGICAGAYFACDKINRLIFTELIEWALNSD